MNLEEDIRKSIVEAGKKLRDHFFVASNDGNISMKLNEEELLITPTGVNKGDMTVDHILKVDMEGNVLSGFGLPSSEIKMHLVIYKRRPKVSAIVHAHPPAATGFAACGINPDDEIILPESILGLGRVGLAEYGTPSTDELPKAVEMVIDDCNALLLANHGAVTIGDTVMEAYYRMEVLEMFSRIKLVTKLLGGANVLNQEQISKLFLVKEEKGLGKLR